MLELELSTVHIRPSLHQRQDSEIAHLLVLWSWAPSASARLQLQGPGSSPSPLVRTRPRARGRDAQSRASRRPHLAAVLLHIPRSPTPIQTPLSLAHCPRQRRGRVLRASLTLLPPPQEQPFRSGADPEAYHGRGNLAGGRRGPGPRPRVRSRHSWCRPRAPQILRGARETRRLRAG